MSNPTNEEIADVLDGARDALIERGWHQGMFSSDGHGGGPVCAVGAIGLADGTTVYNSGDVGIAAEELLERVIAPLGFTSVPLFNDAPERTEDDVHDLLLNAAKALREQAS